MRVVFDACWYKEGASAVCCLMWAFRNENRRFGRKSCRPKMAIDA
jgi:hypothetical protein